MRYKSVSFGQEIECLSINVYINWFVWIHLQDLSTGWLHCDPGPLFTPEYHTLPGWLPEWVCKFAFIGYVIKKKNKSSAEIK